MLNKFSKLVAVLLVILPQAFAQQARVYREGGGWGSRGYRKSGRGQESPGQGGRRVSARAGRFAVGHQLRHSQSFLSSEDRARREFDSYKISAYVRADTAWIVAEWQGGSPHKFSG